MIARCDVPAATRWSITHTSGYVITLLLHTHTHTSTHRVCSLADIVMAMAEGPEQLLRSSVSLTSRRLSPSEIHMPRNRALPPPTVHADVV